MRDTRKEISLREALKLIQVGYRLKNADRDITIFGTKPLSLAGAGDIAFVSADRADKLELAKRCGADVIVCDDEVFDTYDGGARATCLIGVYDPRRVFADLITNLFCDQPSWGVHPSAVIHPEADVHERTYIGPHVYIGRSVVGEGTVILGNTFIDDNVYIGKNVKIRAGCSIGPEGFSHFRDRDGRSVPFPHIGDVIIEDEVEIGSNTCIDRGGLGSTILRKRAIVGNLVYIAHNVDVGENAWIIGNTIISGSTSVGEKAFVSPFACVRDAVRVGAGAHIGMNTLVNRDVPEGETWAGVPGMELSRLLKIRGRDSR